VIDEGPADEQRFGRRQSVRGDASVVGENQAFSSQAAESRCGAQRTVRRPFIGSRLVEAVQAIGA